MRVLSCQCIELVKALWIYYAQTVENKTACNIASWLRHIALFCINSWKSEGLWVIKESTDVLCINI